MIKEISMTKISREKRQKEELVPVDRFNNLHFSLLCHILSFLPTTREVVATSVLSKRWKNLWTCVDTLNFEDRWEYEYNRFMSQGRYVPKTMQFAQFVYRVLLHKKGSIKNMKLACSSGRVDESDVINWINAAIDRGVECLHLNLRRMKIRWPLCLFNGKTIVDVKVLRLDISNLDIPSAPFFPSLKKLCIQDAKFDPETLKQLISGCSALEHLWLGINNSDSCNISSSTLKILELNDFNDDGYFRIRTKILLAVPALQLLRMNCVQSEFFVTDQLSSLVEVDICFRNAQKENDDLCRASLERFLQLISSVKVLRLNCLFSKPLNLVMNAKFHNLTKLTILSPFFEWVLVRSLMESSINLEFLTMTQNRSEKDDQQVLWNNPQDVPHCLLSSLRKISITGYRIEDVLDMETYVLENAKVLERMDIRSLGHKNDFKLRSHVRR